MATSGGNLPCDGCGVSLRPSRLRPPHSASCRLRRQSTLQKLARQRLAALNVSKDAALRSTRQRRLATELLKRRRATLQSALTAARSNTLGLTALTVVAQSTLTAAARTKRKRACRG